MNSITMSDVIAEIKTIRTELALVEPDSAAEAVLEKKLSDAKRAYAKLKREENAAVSSASIDALSSRDLRFGPGTEARVIATVLRATDLIQANGGTLPANWTGVMQNLLRSNLCQGAETTKLGAVNVSEANGVYTVEGRWFDDKVLNHFTVSNNPGKPISFQVMDREGMGELSPTNDSAA